MHAFLPWRTELIKPTVKRVKIIGYYLNEEKYKIEREMRTFEIRRANVLMEFVVFEATTFSCRAEEDE